MRVRIHGLALRLAVGKATVRVEFSPYLSRAERCVGGAGFY